MEHIAIKKGSLQQTIQASDLARYLKAGWVEVEIEADPVQETVKTLKTEREQLAFLRMTKKVPKKFNDGLFISESNREE